MTADRLEPVVSVIMPTYRQAPFLARALRSLMAQTLADWELLIVDDGSPDQTAAAVEPFLSDERICYLRLDRNRGMGAACNTGLDQAQAALVAYLPSDDVYDRTHLADLTSCLSANADAVLAYSGVRNSHRVPGKGVMSDRTSTGQMQGWWLQMVQVMHRPTVDRWMERNELVTDDLDRMFWSALCSRGRFVGTGGATCEWVDHPDQRHKKIREPLGGLNPYRSYYQVAQPLRFHSTQGNYVDEDALYRRFRDRPDTARQPDGMRILLVGELAFNPERVLALEERGHELHGLWTSEGHWFNTVGPLPFGHVSDVDGNDWQAAVRRLQPDIIYALLNWETVPFAHRVLSEGFAAPFVWHFKEGPFDCMANGTWSRLVELCTRSDGVIYSSPEMRQWFDLVLPGHVRDRCAMTLDGDLPKADWFSGDRSARLSSQDGEPHTVVAGGPVGLTPDLMAALASHGVHLHFYGDFHRGQWPEWTEAMARSGQRYFHVHPQVNHDRWVSELSQYDAGWLHLIESTNRGDIGQASWGDLNYPARIPTMMAAGLPLIQYDNTGSFNAQHALSRSLDIGLYFSTVADLNGQLRDPDHMLKLQHNAWSRRHTFTFDHHADRLLRFFAHLRRNQAPANYERTVVGGRSAATTDAGTVSVPATMLPSGIRASAPRPSTCIETAHYQPTQERR